MLRSGPARSSLCGSVEQLSPAGGPLFRSVEVPEGGGYASPSGPANSQGVSPSERKLPLNEAALVDQRFDQGGTRLAEIHSPLVAFAPLVHPP
jgi:hypothetical protein